ncbi:hypothetical protein [Sphingorhabdus sp.]|uniref:hypothetical protein n=1 Tax=Sphingorhabdus sp. TaxID=1902408 RepID=UPI00391D0025
MISAVERALELAKSGDYQTIIEIERELRKEGFDNVLEHLDGAFTRRQLMAAMKAANLTELKVGHMQNRISGKSRG